jgi:acetyl-CoA carboxylase biotin carboxyl carrier protein
MADAESQQSQVFDEERLQRLIELMKEHSLSEVELRDADQQIRICRPTAEGVVFGSPAAAGYPPAAGPAQPEAMASSETDGEHIAVISSPMVGTYYSRPNPNSQQFVKVGDHVEPETTVCIIEAMKVFNEIPAEVSGKIVAILIDDEEAVEFGRPLFKVDTRG